MTTEKIHPEDHVMTNDSWLPELDEWETPSLDLRDNSEPSEPNEITHTKKKCEPSIEDCGDHHRGGDQKALSPLTQPTPPEKHHCFQTAARAVAAKKTTAIRGKKGILAVFGMIAVLIAGWIGVGGHKTADLGAPQRTTHADAQAYVQPASDHEQGSNLDDEYGVRPIEQIRVGQRAITEPVVEAKTSALRDRLSPESESAAAEGVHALASREDRDPHSTAVDPPTWRLIRLRAEERWDDGTIDDLNIETLQPLSWIRATNVHLGGESWIPLDVNELSVSVDIKATVIDILPCPEIEPGPGRVVLTTVNHLNRYVFELTVEDSQNQTRTIEVTGLHTFFSATYQNWTRAIHLKPGQQLDGLKGAVTVVSIQKKPGLHRVYDLTVERDHVYRVSSLGVLAHNNSSAPDEIAEGKKAAIEDMAREDALLEPNDAEYYVNPDGDTLRPGPYAHESIPGHRGRPTAAEQRAINELMERNGCHTCGTHDPGTPSGNAVVDHYPAEALGEPREFLPHCQNCARRQGGQVGNQLRKGRIWFSGH